MILFDTHGHLADSAFDPDRAQVLQRLQASGVACAMVVADPCESIPNEEAVRALVTERHDLYGAIGVHPQNASGYSDAVETVLRRYLAMPEFICLGEIGLDYHYDDAPSRNVKQHVFLRQLALAKELRLPAELHIRDAHGDATALLRELFRNNALPQCIMHCYTGSWESAQGYLDMGMYISLSGSVTFKNAPKLKEIARKLPADRILIETDCPYLAPVPLRGSRNEPSYVAHTAACIAEIRGESPEAFAQQTFENALRVFGLPAPGAHCAC